MLSGVQHQPVELNWIDHASPRRCHSWEGTLPGLIRGRFESLKQLETRFAETTNDGFGRFDRRGRIPGRFSMVELSG